MANRADVPPQEHLCPSVVTTDEVCSQQNIATCINYDWTHSYWDPMPNATANSSLFKSAKTSIPSICTYTNCSNNVYANSYKSEAAEVDKKCMHQPPLTGNISIHNTYTTSNGF